jgi:hypothetical protein
LNVLDRIKRDLNKFKEASAHAGDGARLSNAEKNEIIKKLKKAQEEANKIKTYFISATIDVTTTYEKGTKKYGDRIQDYDDTHKNAKIIEARNEKEAVSKFAGDVIYLYNEVADYGCKSRNIKSINNVNVKTEKDFKSASETNMYMRAANPIEYNFFSQDTTHLTNNGFCVLETFVGVYGQLIKKLDTDYFIKLCYKVRGETPPVDNKFFNRLDAGINIDDDEENNFDINNKGWTIEKGVTPDMINKICIELNISHFAFEEYRNVQKLSGAYLLCN